MGLFGRKPPEPENISLANSKFFKNEPNELPEFFDKDAIPTEEPKPVIKDEEVPVQEAPIQEAPIEPVQAETPVMPDPVRPSLDERALIDSIDSIVMAMKELGNKREHLNQQLSAKESAIEAILLQLAAEQTEKEELTTHLAETDIEWNRLKAELKRLSD